MNPGSTKDIKRLRQAIGASRKTLATFREKRLELLKDFVGSHYGDGGTRHEMPLNVLALAAMVYGRQLFAKCPRVMVRTPHKELKWRATNFELLISHTLGVLGFKPQMDAVVMNALFGVGLMKVGLAGAGTVNIGGQEIEYGQPYAKSVDLDDWVHDTAAKSWDEIAYCGNRYRVPLAYAQSYASFDPEVRASLKPTYRYAYDEEGARAESLGGGDERTTDEYEDYVELWDIWIPREGLVVTLPVEGGDRPLSAVKWEGPREGPYKVLSFIPVPNNLMPVAPAAHWKDLNNLVNSLMRKLSRQAERQKEVGLARPGGGDDADRVVASNDGEVIRSDDPKNVGMMRFGGPDQATLLFMLQAKSQLSWLAGNLDSMGGLSPQADTLGQERLLQENSSRQLAEMQSRVVQFVKDVVHDIGWWVWTDKLSIVPLTKKIQGTSIEVQAYFRPEDRKGQFLDYNMDIDPYSMRDTSPGERLQAIIQFVTQMLPLLPIMQQEGFAPNIEAFFRLYSKYSNTEEIDDLLTFQRQPQPIAAGVVNTGSSSPASAPKPAETTRTERRISMPGASRQGTDALMGMMMSGQGIQPNEAAAVGRAA